MEINIKANGPIGYGYKTASILPTNLRLKYVPYQAPVWEHEEIGGPRGVYVKAVPKDKWLNKNPRWSKGQKAIMADCFKTRLVTDLAGSGIVNTNPLAVISHLINAGWLEVVKP
jgi:hypothetical protein